MLKRRNETDSAKSAKLLEHLNKAQLRSTLNHLTDRDVYVVVTLWSEQFCEHFFREISNDCDTYTK